MVQFTLPKLIKDIENFYQEANQAYLLSKAQQGGYSMPDDPSDDDEKESSDLYTQMIDLAHKVGEPDLVDNLLVVAELYKNAIEHGSGFSTVNMAINALLDHYMVEEDSPEYEEFSAIEFVLNQVITDIRNRAGGPAMLRKPDAPDVMARLKVVKESLREKDKSIEDEMDELSNFQKEETGIDGEDPGMTAAQMGQMSKEEAGQGRGAGWHTVNTRRKNWSQGYENERLRYIDLLTVEKNPEVLANLKKLIGVLGSLRDEIVVVQNLQSALTATPDEETQAKLLEAKEELSKLRQARAALKQGIRNYELNVNKAKIENQIGAGRLDPKEQFKLQQEADLLGLMLSTDRRKGKERALRSKLVEYLKAGSWPTGETMDKILQNIKDAKQLRVTRKEYNEQEAQRVANTKQTIRLDPNVRLNVYNWAAMKLDGFITHLSQNILGERKTAKDRILGTKNKKVNEAEKSLFKPYMDAIADAANKKDRGALVTATRALREKIKESIRLTPEFTQYLISVRSSKFFYAYRDRVKHLQKLGAENKGTLTSQEIAFIQDTINVGKQLISFYRNLTIKPIRSRTPYETGYKTPTATIEKINTYLQAFLEAKPNIEGKSEKIDPETGEVTYE